MSTLVKPYGDTHDDGAVQLSFTLPVEWSEAADEAARQLVAKMGFADVAVAEGRRIAAGFSFFVVYARTPVIGRRLSDHRPLGTRRRRCRWKTSTRFVRDRVRRKIRVAGACIGTDAHTVGIDAILNMKGYKGDYGLERYREFETFNLGSQVAIEDSCGSRKRARYRRAAGFPGRHAEGQRRRQFHGAGRTARGRGPARARAAAVRRPARDQSARRGTRLRRGLRSRDAAERGRLVRRPPHGRARRRVASACCAQSRSAPASPSPQRPPPARRSW